MKALFCVISFLLLLSSGIFFCANATSAATFQEIAPNNEDTDLRIRRVRFSGNSSISNSNLQKVIRTRSNRNFLGIPGLTLWYQLHKITDRLGEPPALLDKNVLERDRERVQRFYEAKGFRQASIQTQIIPLDNDRVEISFLIEEGPVSQIRNIYYSGLPDRLSGDEITSFLTDSELFKESINDTSFIAGRPFTYDLVADERNRIIEYLRNTGYASVSRDSVIAVVRENHSQPLQLDIMFRIYHGKPFGFGDVFIDMKGPDGTFESPKYETYFDDPYTIRPHRIFVRVDPSAKTKNRFLAEQLLFTPGENFHHQSYRNTLTRFQNLGMLTVNQYGHTEDGSLSDYRHDFLPVHIHLQALPKHRVQLDFFGMRRLGFGAGAGLRYINNNFFGGAERFEIGLQGNFEFVSGTLLNSTELSTAYTVPRLNFPLRDLDQTPFFINTSTRYRLSWAQSMQENFSINANFRFNNQFEVRHRPQTASLFDMIELDWLDASATSTFEQNLRDRFDDITVDRILEDFNPQFSSILRYTLRHASTDLIKRNYGFFSESSFEIGGTIPYLLDLMIFEPDEVKGTVPSFNLSDSTLTYSQFLRVSVDYRNYTPVLTNGVFAWRAFAGFGYAYGVNRQIPLNRRFFAGGSNDIRGWPPLRLGPADLDPSAGEVPINGGDIKLAGFIEYRHTILQSFLNTGWQIAGFTDFGNIWYGPRSPFPEGQFKFNDFFNQIAVGSGFGVRFDWEYLVFRIDVAYRIHDLQRGWFKNSNPYWHFGIGHSF